MISGQLNSNGAAPIPAGEPVDVTLNGVSQKATLNSSDDFSTTFTTATLAASSSAYTISYSYAGDANFPSASAESSLTVNPTTLTITASNQIKTYGFGGSSSALGTTAFASSGLQNSDTIASVTLTTSDGTSTSSNYKVTSSPATITPSAAVFSSGSSGNYSITYANAATGLTVNPAPLTVTGISGTNTLYDGSTSDPLTGTPSLSGKVAGDIVTLGGTGVGTLASANPGAEAVTVSGYTISGPDAGNYRFSQPTVASITVAPSATLGSYALHEPYTSGSDQDSVTADGAWTATANVSWLHTSSSGSGNGVATFTFDANPGRIRIGTLTIGGATLLVTQAAGSAIVTVTNGPTGIEPTTSWMAALPDSIPLTDISMPGTDNSASISVPTTDTSAQGPTMDDAFLGDSASTLVGQPNAQTYAAITAHFAATTAGLVALGTDNPAAAAAALAADIAALSADSAAGTPTDSASALGLAADSAAVLADIAGFAVKQGLPDAVADTASAVADTAAAGADTAAAAEFKTYANYIANNISTLAGGNPNNIAILTTLETDANAEFGAHTAAATTEGAAALADTAAATADGTEEADEAAEATDDAEEAEAVAQEPIDDAAEVAADATEVASTAAAATADTTAIALDATAAATVEIPFVDIGTAAAALTADGVAAAADVEETAATVADVAANAALAEDTTAIGTDAAEAATEAGEVEAAMAKATPLKKAQTAANAAASLAGFTASSADAVFTAELQSVYSMEQSLLTHSKTITEQLNAGVRSLDIRGTLVNDTINVNSGQYFTGLTLQDVLNECTAFLAANPSETIVMSLSSNENPQGPVNSSNSFNADLNTLLNSTDTAVTGNQTYNDFMYYSSSPTTTPDLGQVRGKIVIIPNSAMATHARRVGTGLGLAAARSG